uniref:Uncharacterized protein n=1 Tax=Caenorhabditis japonica TaxID=281687 RepID=A0A8R1IRQ6_CAEJA
MSDISENIEYNLDTIQYTIPNYGFSDPYELAQYVNRIIAVGLCILVHLNVIIRLLFCNKNRVTSDYQILIIIQSAINLIACVSELVLNEIQTLNIRYLKIGHPFWQFTSTERLIYTLIMAVSSNSTQDFLMLFNLHRLIMIRRRSNLLTLYMIALPLMVIGSCMDAIESYPLILVSLCIYVYVQVI